MDLTDLHVEKKSDFVALRRAFCLRKLRNHIMRWMLDGNENDFFDLDEFNRSLVRDTTITNELVELVTAELQSLGWKTFLGFGGTGLYVYSSEEPPANAY